MRELVGDYFRRLVAFFVALATMLRGGGPH
jgi:hypothetical protein